MLQYNIVQHNATQSKPKKSKTSSKGGDGTVKCNNSATEALRACLQHKYKLQRKSKKKNPKEEKWHQWGSKGASTSHFHQVDLTLVIFPEFSGKKKSISKVKLFSCPRWESSFDIAVVLNLLILQPAVQPVKLSLIMISAFVCYVFRRKRKNGEKISSQPPHKAEAQRCSIIIYYVTDS